MTLAVIVPPDSFKHHLSKITLIDSTNEVKLQSIFSYQAYLRSRRELEVHVQGSPHQRSMRGSELSLVTVIRFTINCYS